MDTLLVPDVVNVQLAGATMGIPLVLVTPLRLAEYVVEALSELLGVKVRTVPALLSVVVPEMAFPLGSVSVKTDVPGCDGLVEGHRHGRCDRHAGRRLDGTMTSRCGPLVSD